MPITALSDIRIGQVVRFRTISPHDNVVWNGRIVSICDYDTARQMADVDPMYKDVKTVLPTMDIREELTYIALMVQEDSEVENSKVRRVFALDWIDKSTFEFISVNSYVDYRVFNVSSDRVQDILDLLLAHGYNAQITKTFEG